MTLTLNELVNLVLKSLKNKFELDDGDDKDKALISALTDLTYKAFIDVVEYCNINYDEVNMQLVYTIYYIIHDKFYSDSLVMESDDNGMVKSIREGDVTVTKHTLLERANYITKDKSLLSNYYSLLNKFRRVRD